MKKKRVCCCIPDQSNLDGCQKLAEYQIWMGENPTPDDYTESCAEHLKEMLNNSTFFTVYRIAETNDKREQLADYAHDAWSGWMKYMFSKCTKNLDGSMTIPANSVERWTH